MLDGREAIGFGRVFKVDLAVGSPKPRMRSNRWNSATLGIDATVWNACSYG